MGLGTETALPVIRMSVSGYMSQKFFVVPIIWSSVILEIVSKIISHHSSIHDTDERVVLVF